MRVGKSPDERHVPETSRQPLGRPAPIPIVVMASRKPGRPRNLRSANQNLAGMTTLADQHRRRSFRDGLAGGDADGLAQGGADGHRLAGGGGECLVGAAGHRQPLGSDDSVLPPGNAGGLLVSQAGGVRNDFAAIPTSRPDSIELPVSWKKSAANSARDADSACLSIHFARLCEPFQAVPRNFCTGDENGASARPAPFSWESQAGTASVSGMTILAARLDGNEFELGNFALVSWRGSTDGQ
jgi:hypothetical protein